VIEFNHVYKTYPGPTHALRDVNLSIARGEFAFLTGPSGAGKTTLFRMLSAYEKPTSGQLKVSTFDLHKITIQEIPHYRRQLGVVYQDFRLMNNSTVFENVALPLRILGQNNQEVHDRVYDILVRVKLVDRIHAFPLQMSGGEQQRVAIARAMIHRPRLIIADEPTGNLDPALTEEIMDLFEDANAQGTTVFVSTHDHDLVRRRNKRVIKIERGEILRPHRELIYE
jgi:cell division transport system ATP-binding protein